MNVIDWLLDSDPAIRWQVMRDLLHAPASEVAVERSKVANEGWGARLLALQDETGQWGREVLPPGGKPEGLPDPATRRLLRELQGLSIVDLADYIGTDGENL